MSSTVHDAAIVSGEAGLLVGVQAPVFECCCTPVWSSGR